MYILNNLSQFLSNSSNYTKDVVVFFDRHYKFYIGSSKNLSKRWTQHKSDLKNKTHINIILQRSWNKYGEDSFSFEIVEECHQDILLNREQHYIDTLKPEFNIGKKTYGGDNITNHPNRNKIIEKITNGLYKRYQNMSLEDRKHLSEIRMGENNSNYGNRWSDEKKEEQSRKLKKFFETHIPCNKGKTLQEICGKEKSDEVRKKLSIYASQRTGDKNPFYKKTHTEETKNKLRDIRIGKYNGKQNIPFLIDGVEYKSLGEASRKLDIPIPTILWRLKSKNKKFENYLYETK